MQYLYTGSLPDVHPLRVLPLAHRLELADCVAECVTALESVEAPDVPDAFKVLKPLLGDPAVDSAWDRLLERTQSDRGLLDSVLKNLVKNAVLDHAEDCSSDYGGPPATSQWPHSIGETAQDAQDVTPPLTMSSGISPAIHYTILHFHRAPSALKHALCTSEFGKELKNKGVDLTPDWAQGAKIFIEGLSAEDVHDSSLDLQCLRPWHVVVRPEDVPRILQALQALPYRGRPRAKAKMARRGVLRTGRACRHKQMEPMRVEASDTASLASEGRWIDSSSAMVPHPSDPGRMEVPAELDQETASAIARARAESFLEDRRVVATNESSCELPCGTPVQNAFIHFQDGDGHSPRTHYTA